MSTENKWLHVINPRPRARMRLFCLHYAGGAAQMYNGWQRKTPADIEVCALQMPGRWSRFKEPPLLSVEAMARGAAEAIAPLLDRPYAIFGHSLGAAVGFEMIHALAENGAPCPVRLFVSARNAPHRPSAAPELHRLPEAQFIAVLRDHYGALPQEILDDPDMGPIFLRVLRADLEAIETYRYVRRAPIEVPITAMGGRSDSVADAAQLEAWGDLTTAGSSLQMFDGDHFFIRPREDEVLEMIGRSLEPELLLC